FFSSRRRHTRSKRDWSSDVCSSDLAIIGADPSRQFEQLFAQNRCVADYCFDWPDTFRLTVLENTNNSGQGRFIAERHPHAGSDRSEERRVGKGGRCRGGPESCKEKV